MLVRARRLVWERVTDDHFVAFSNGDKYTVYHSETAAYTGYKIGLPNGRWSPAESIQNARDIAQDLVDQRWLAETEVMPLEWEEGACESSFDDGVFYYEVADDRYWLSKSQVDGIRCDSRDHGKQLCNEHHRKLVLGE